MCIENITPTTISDLVLKKRKGGVEYEKLQARFACDIEKLAFRNSIPVDYLVGPNRGPANARSWLVNNLFVDWFLFGERDFTGIYVWYHQEKPFYVGISRGVLKRLKQHVNGKSHFSASMAYKIARLLCNDYEGGRETFDPECRKIGKVQEWLLKQRVAMLPIPDPDHLALFEIYCAMKLDTVLNTFETH